VRRAGALRGAAIRRAADACGRARRERGSGRDARSPSRGRASARNSEFGHATVERACACDSAHRLTGRDRQKTIRGRRMRPAEAAVRPTRGLDGPPLRGRVAETRVATMPALSPAAGRQFSSGSLASVLPPPAAATCSAARALADLPGPSGVASDAAGVRQHAEAALVLGADEADMLTIQEAAERVRLTQWALYRARSARRAHRLQARREATDPRGRPRGVAAIHQGPHESTTGDALRARCAPRGPRRRSSSWDGR
jgi:hypothetical protein